VPSISSRYKHPGRRIRTLRLLYFVTDPDGAHSLASDMSRAPVRESVQPRLQRLVAGIHEEAFGAKHVDGNTRSILHMITSGGVWPAPRR
jgi:hypothetical protein